MHYFLELANGATVKINAHRVHIDENGDITFLSHNGKVISFFARLDWVTIMVT